MIPTCIQSYLEEHGGIDLAPEGRSFWKQVLTHRNYEMFKPFVYLWDSFLIPWMPDEVFIYDKGWMVSDNRAIKVTKAGKLAPKRPRIFVENNESTRDLLTRLTPYKKVPNVTTTVLIPCIGTTPYILNPHTMLASSHHKPYIDIPTDMVILGGHSIYPYSCKSQLHQLYRTTYG